MSRKKILWLCSWYPNKTEPFNGDFIQRHARAAALFNDITVIYVCEDPSGKTRSKLEEHRAEEGVHEHIIYLRKSAGIIGKVLSHYQWVRSFRAAIKAYVQLNGQPDLVHVHVPFKAGMIAQWMFRKYDLPFIVTEHWGIYNEVEEHNYAVKSSLFKHHTKAIFSDAKEFISVSRFLGNGVNKMVLKKPYIVVPNVVDTRSFYYNTSKLASRPFRFLHVSNMATIKNVAGILRAFEIFLSQGGEAELVLAGAPTKEILLDAECPALRNRISFRGEIPYEKVAEEMQQSDALILFSHMENSPCVIGEALCCGLPVIASNAGGIPELVSPEDGLLVEPGNEAALAETLHQMIRLFSGFNRENISQMATVKFSYEVVGKQFDEIYVRVIAR